MFKRINREDAMVWFVVLSRLTDEGAKTLKERPERVREVNKELERYGVKVVHQFVTFGEYDFVNVVEVDRPENLLKALIELNSRGSVRTTTLYAFPVDEAIRALKS